MSIAFRRRTSRSQPRVEALEARALLAVAGSLDPGFGGGYGSSTVSIGAPVLSNIGVQTNSVAATPDGHILVIGTIEVRSSDSFAQSILELNADGSPDTTFGVGGQVQQSITFQAIAVQSNGQIIEATNDHFGGGQTYLAIRLNANGSVNTTFGTNGVAEYPTDSTTPVANRIDKVVAALIQSNGQIILAGTSSAGFSAVRLNANGSLDTTYGQAGTTTVPVMVSAGAFDTATAAAIQSNGQVVLTGNVQTMGTVIGGFEVTNSDVAVIRLNTDGSLDMTYGGTNAAGIVLIPADLANPMNQGINQAKSVAVQPSTGDILVAGNDEINTSTPTPTSFNTLYRLNTDGTLDAGFGTAGLIMPNFPNATNAGNLAVQADGDILLSGSVYYNSPGGNPNQYNIELLRLNADGSPDATFGNTSTPGVLLTRLTTSAFATPAPAIDSTTGNILLTGVGTVPSLTGLTYGFTVDSVLPAASTGVAALPVQTPPAAFWGLGLSDLAVYDPSTGSFLYQSTIDTSQATRNTQTYPFQFGIPGVGQTIPAAADYQGAGYSQFAAYLTDSGYYAVLPTATSPGLFLQFGIPGAGQTIPAPADYEGTGKADVAIYMPSIATFAILPSDGSPGRVVPFGQPGLGNSIPAPADYFGTGQADIAVYLTQIGAFAIRNPVTNQDTIVPFGMPGVGKSIPVPGDYDGSGKTELAVYIPSLGAFFYRPADGGPDVEVAIGTPNSGELPVPGDYDGSGRTEVAIYDPNGGFIEYQPANGGPEVTIPIGTANNGSIPVAAPAGSLPEFNTSKPPLGLGIRAGAIVPPSAASGSPAAITLSQISAVPAGPTLASVRVPRALVNQAAPDPLELA